MAHLVSQLVMPGQSNMPEDVFVNVHHWSSASADVTGATVVTDHLVELMNVAVPAQTPAVEALGSFIGQAVKRDVNACRIKVYNMADAKPRPVLFERTFTLVGVGTGHTTDLPAEVAVCTSYYSGRNVPRQRGRSYLGPLSSRAVQQSALGRAAPTEVLRRSMVASYKRLITKGANTQNLAVWSKVDQQLRIVTAGWVDDAFDTQRRRGQDASGRLTFTNV